MRQIIRRCPFGILHFPEPSNSMAEEPAVPPRPVEPKADALVPVTPPPGGQPDVAVFAASASAVTPATTA